MSQYVWKFRLFGVPVAVLPSFWFLCVAFSPFLSEIDPETPWVWGLLGWTAATTLAFDEIAASTPICQEETISRS